MAASSRVSEPTPAGAERSRPVAVWLFIVAALVFMMVVVGGATRLTGSGLSITEWKPVSGVLPPLTHSAWAGLFGQYRATAQYRLVNRGISLGEFQFLFWWEWAHRLLARWVGVVFAVPLAVFLVSRRLPSRLIGRCFVLLALGGLQGLVGWWMVKSGLEGRTAVLPERLATHLGLALALLVALVWTALEALAGRAPANQASGRAWRLGSALLAAGVYLQCLMGALVAGTHGGLVDNDWPLMGGRLAPSDYWQGAVLTTFIHGPAAAQFNHRLVAYALLVSGFVMLVAAVRAAPRFRALLAPTAVVVLLLTLQAVLGVATLLAGDPLWLALGHQANAALLLSAATVLAWSARRV